MTGIAGTALGLLPGFGWLLPVKRILSRIFGPLWSWLVADWRNGPLFMLALLAAAHIFWIDPGLRDQRDAWQAKHAAEKQAHDRTIADFVAASHRAERIQAGNLARVKSEQDAISERIEHDYEARIAALHTRAANIAGSLRAGQAAIGFGLSGAAGMPGSGQTSGSAAEAPGDHRLSSTGSCEPMNLEERIVATEQAIQLDSLIGWVIEQAAVQTSPASTP